MSVTIDNFKRRKYLALICSDEAQVEHIVVLPMEELQDIQFDNGYIRSGDFALRIRKVIKLGGDE